MCVFVRERERENVCPCVVIREGSTRIEIEQTRIGQKYTYDSSSLSWVS